jgi:hypothetical protein
VRREVWREKRITARRTDGQEYAKDELDRGEVVEMAEFGDQTSAVVADDSGRFDVVDVPSGSAEDLERGDSVRVSRIGETTLERQNQRERGLER